MFENQNEQEVEALMQSNYEFRTLYTRHRELDDQVDTAERAKIPMDETALHALKKAKLHAKDRLDELWSELRPSAS
ncbi:MAG: YdcH family protein [Dokdonella sp.]